MTSSFTVTNFLTNTPNSDGSVVASLNLAPNFGQTCFNAFGSNAGPRFAADLTGGALIGLASPQFTAAFMSVGTFAPATGGTSAMITEITVPEPATVRLIGMGLAGIALADVAALHLLIDSDSPAQSRRSMRTQRHVRPDRRKAVMPHPATVRPVMHRYPKENKTSRDPDAPDCAMKKV